jgi:amino acid transporter
VCGDVMVVGTPKKTMSPIVVLLLLFFVLGPFGFGMLWRSNRFSPAWKIALTIITLVWTVYITWAIYAGVSSALDSIMGGSSGDLDKALQNIQNM